MAPRFRVLIDSNTRGTLYLSVDEAADRAGVYRVNTLVGRSSSATHGYAQSIDTRMTVEDAEAVAAVIRRLEHGRGE